MHATFRRYVASDLADKLASHSDEIKALIGGVPGVRAYYLIQAGMDTVSVTISDDEAGGEQSSATAARWIAENMPEIATSPPVISTGEVVISL